MEMDIITGNDDSPPGADTRYGYQSEMALWTLLPQDLSREKTIYVNVSSMFPITPRCDLQYNVMGNSLMYYDLKNIKAIGKVRVLHMDGSPLGPDEHVSLTNYPLASMWEKVDLYLQQQLVCSSGTAYPYRSMFDVLLESDWSDIDSVLRQGLFVKDAAGYMDSTHSYEDVNEGFITRQKYMKESKIFELQGRLHIDLFRQERVLVNGVQLTIKLTQSSDAFRIMAHQDENGQTHRYKLELVDLKLKIPMIKPSSSILLAHDAAFKRGPALYPFERTELRVISIPAGMTQWTVDNLFLTAQPKRLLLAFIAAAAYNGDYNKNPFNFQHFFLSYLCLMIDGTCFPSQALQPDFENDFYLECYDTLFDIAPDERIGQKRKVTTITRDEYPNGYALFLFNLDGDTQGSESVTTQMIGLNKLEMRFARPTPEPINLLIYPAFNALMRIDDTRNVKVDG